DGIRDRNVTGVQTCALPIYPDQITLVRNNIKQFVLLKETGDRRVAFVPLSARLDGDRYEVFLAKSEAQHDVSNRFAHPVRGDHRSEERRVGKECRSRVAMDQ